MIRFLLDKMISRHKAAIHREAAIIQGFMHLLMKPVNSAEKWTREEKQQIRADLKHLSLFVPALIIFLLPGGSLLLPILADILDRRSDRR